MLNLDTKNKIFDLIKQNDRGIGCSEISKTLKINRVTLSKYLSVLHSEGLIYYRGFGMARVWYVEKNPLLECFRGNNGHAIKNVLDSIGDGILVVDNNLSIIWANKAMKDMAKDHEDLNGVHFFDLFKEAKKLEEDLKINKIQKTTFNHENNQKVKTTISPILNINNDSVGFIHVLNIEKND